MYKQYRKPVFRLYLVLIALAIYNVSFAQCGGLFEPCELCGISARITSIENADIIDGTSSVAGSIPAGGTKMGSPMEIRATGCGVISIQVELTFEWGQGSSRAWIHGISFESSSGWSAAEGVDPGSGWIFLNSITGVCSDNTYGPGYFWDNAGNDQSSFNPNSGGCSGFGALFYVEEDNDPSDNWGIDCTDDCPDFSFDMEYCPNVNGTVEETISFILLEDGESGGWADVAGCNFIIDLPITISSAGSILPQTLQICEGETATLDVGNGCTTYLWDNGDTGSTIQVSPTTDEIYTVTATSGAGCETVATVAVQVEVCCAVEAGILGLSANTLCPGETVTANVTNQTIETNYGQQLLLVNSAGIVIDEIQGANGEFTLNDCDVYTVYSYNYNIGEGLSSISIGNSINGINCAADCCALAGSLVSATDNTPPVLDFSPPDLTLCDTVIPDAALLAWTDDCDGAGSVEATEMETSLNGLPTIIRTWAYTDVCGNIATRTQNIVIANPVAATITGQTVFCAGEETILGTDNPYDTYLWTCGETTPTIAVSESGLYGVTVSNEFGCTTVSTISISANPVPAFSIMGLTTFCTGTSSIIGVSETYDNYLWSTGETSEGIEVTSGGIYSVTVTDANGCTGVESVGVFENEFLLPTISGDLVFCENSSSILDAGEGFTSYLWSTGETSSTIEVNGTDTYSVTVSDGTGCTGETQVSVLEQANELVAVITGLSTPSGFDCTISSLVLDGSNSTSGDNLLYQWYVNGNPLTEGSESVLEIFNAGNYMLEVLDTISGCASMDAIDVPDFTDFPIVSINPTDELTCQMETVQIAGNSIPFDDTMSFEWTTNGGNFVSSTDEANITVDAAGWYYFTVTDQSNGCENQDSILVIADLENPTAIAGEDVTLDCFDGETQLSSAGSTPTNPWMYQWENTGEPNIEGPAVTVNQAGTYTLVVTDMDNSCTATDTVVVYPPVYPVLDMATATDPPCLNNTFGSIYMDGVSSGTTPYLYAVNGSDFTTAAVFTDLDPGTYTVVVQDAAGCETDSTFVLNPGIEVALELGEEQMINLGQAADLSAQTNLLDTQIQQIIWTPAEFLSCADCPDPIASPLETTTYMATITDVNGCSMTDQITIEVDTETRVYIPSAFSPNDDGINDEFSIYTNESVAQVARFQVFDRWGNQVFENTNFPANDPSQGWDGSYKNKNLGAAVFVYLVEVVYVNGRTDIFSGDVTLIR